MNEYAKSQKTAKITQPRVSALQKGKINEFRLDMLIDFALRPGLHVSIDVDFLVDMEKGRSLLDLLCLQEDLSKEIDRHVDVITTKSLNRHIKNEILSEAIPL